MKCLDTSFLKKCLIIISFMLSSTFFVHAQVTIGGKLVPNDGSLLDLKQFDPDPQTNATATKGLLLPRVKLTDLNSLKDIEIGTGLNENDIHTGLTVYNAEVCNPGVFVWNGSSWQALIVPDIKTFTAPSGNTYKIKDFGEAGVWMIENLRETAYSSGEVLEEMIQDPNDSPDNKRYYYPRNVYTGDANTDRDVFDQHPEYGLFYTYAAAANGVDKWTDLLLMNTAGATGSQLQGICPEGWVLPSDYDWNVLEKVIAEDYIKYSYNSDTEWNPAWSSASGWRPSTTAANAHGNSMKACGIVLANTPEGYAQSGLSKKDGFSVLLVGRVNVGVAESSYSIRAFYWSSSVYEGGVYPIVRVFRNDFSSVYRANDDTYTMKTNMFSVRCKKKGV